MHLEVSTADRQELNRAFGQVEEFLIQAYPNFHQGKNFFGYILEELLANVTDHSQAEKLLLEVDESAKLMVVRVADNGVGIFVTLRSRYPDLLPAQAIGQALHGLSSKSGQRGFGLRTSRALVDKVNGRFSVQSDNRGTTVVIELSKDIELADADFYAIIQGQ